LARSGWRAAPRMVVQVAISSFRGAQAHPRSDVLDGEGRFPPQPRGDLQLVRIALPALLQFPFLRSKPAQPRSYDPLRLRLGCLAVQFTGVVFPQAPFHAQEHLPLITLAAQTPATPHRSKNPGIGLLISLHPGVGRASPFTLHLARLMLLAMSDLCPKMSGSGIDARRPSR